MLNDRELTFISTILWCFLWAKASSRMAAKRELSTTKWFWIGWVIGCFGPILLHFMRPIKGAARRLPIKSKNEVIVPKTRAATKKVSPQEADRKALVVRSGNGDVLAKKGLARPLRSASQSDKFALQGWFFSRAGEPEGPVSREKLFEFVRKGSLSHGSLIWRSGMKQWTPFHEVARRLRWQVMNPVAESKVKVRQESLGASQKRKQSPHRKGGTALVLGCIAVVVACFLLVKRNSGATRGAEEVGEGSKVVVQSIKKALENERDIKVPDALEIVNTGVDIPRSRYSDSSFPLGSVIAYENGIRKSVDITYATCLRVSQDGTIVLDGKIVDASSGWATFIPSDAFLAGTHSYSGGDGAIFNVQKLPGALLCADKWVRWGSLAKLAVDARKVGQIGGGLWLLCATDDMEQPRSDTNLEFLALEMPPPVSRLKGLAPNASRVVVEVVCRDVGKKVPRQEMRATDIGESTGYDFYGEEVVWAVKGPDGREFSAALDASALKSSVAALLNDDRNWWIDKDSNQMHPCIGVIMPRPNVSLRHLVLTMDVLRDAGVEIVAVEEWSVHGGRGAAGLATRNDWSANLKSDSKSNDSTGWMAEEVTYASIQAAESIALDWLLSHQDAGGGWEPDGYGSQGATGSLADSRRSPVHGIGVTGLALIAVIQSGLPTVESVFHDCVKKAAYWLASQQNGETGLFGSGSSADFIYGQAIASFAMVLASDVLSDDIVRSSAQAGLKYLEKHRNPGAVWRYQSRDNDNDSSVTGWCVRALLAGRARGFEVEDSGLQVAVAWFDHVTDSTGRCGYSSIGEPSSRRPGDHGVRYPVEFGEAMTSVGLLARIDMGQSPRETPVMMAAADLILSKPPVWDVESGRLDFYYWYHASSAIARIGGRHRDDWRRHMEVAALKGQRLDGDFRGSWDPVDVWGQDGGRVYATCMMALSLIALNH